MRKKGLVIPVVVVNVNPVLLLLDVVLVGVKVQLIIGRDL